MTSCPLANFIAQTAYYVQCDNCPEKSPAI